MSLSIAGSAFKSWFRVRGGLAGPLLFIFIMFAVEGSFWRSVSGATGAVQGYTRPQMLLYIFSALIISQICACVGEPDSLAQRVESGNLDAFLLRPASYIGQMLSLQLGCTAARALVLAPLLPLCEVLLTGQVHWDRQLAAAALLPAASMINFFINHIIATLAFYFRDSYAFVVFKETLCWVLNGTLIPLELLPGLLGATAVVAPPAFVVYYPAKVLLGDIPFGGIAAGQLLFLALLWSIAAGTWNLGVSKYQAYGA